MTRWGTWICGVLLAALVVARWAPSGEDVPVPEARRAAAERLHAHLKAEPPREDWTVEAVEAEPGGLRVRVEMPMVQVASLMGGPPLFRKDRLAQACPAPSVLSELDVAGPVTIEGRSPHRDVVADVVCPGPFGSA